MEIKDENIARLMLYFDDFRNTADRALVEYDRMYKQGIIKRETYRQATVDITLKVQEHNKIRKILFGD